jgi:hypothetical protein
MNCRTCLPISLISIIGSEYYEKPNTGHEYADSIGMFEVIDGKVYRTVVSSVTVPMEVNGEVDEDREEAGDGAFVEGGAVDAKEEVQAVDAFEIVNHVGSWRWVVPYYL